MELLKNKKLGNIDHSWNQHLEQGILNTTNNTSIVVIFGILIKFGSYCICVAANFVLLCVFLYLEIMPSRSSLALVSQRMKFSD